MIILLLAVVDAVQIRPDDRTDPSKSPDSEQSFSLCRTRHAPHPRRTPTIQNHLEEHRAGIQKDQLRRRYVCPERCR
jgi:hypothetical protein